MPDDRLLKNEEDHIPGRVEQLNTVPAEKRIDELHMAFHKNGGSGGHQALETAEEHALESRGKPGTADAEVERISAEGTSEMIPTKGDTHAPIDPEHMQGEYMKVRSCLLAISLTQPTSES